jgi:hypothetical protein
MSIPVMTKKLGRKQLARRFDEQHGKCCYCDGDAWLWFRESPEQARTRLGIPGNVPGTAKMLRAAKATREHLHRVTDGGKNGVENIKMACMYCNSQRWENDPDVHRIDMQVLVAAGLHPTNRPKVIDDLRTHRKLGNRAIKLLRGGKSIEEIGQ